MLIYTPERTEKLESKVKKGRIAITLTAFCALIVSIIMCIKTNTANSETMMYTVMALSTLAGWAVLIIYDSVIKPSKAEASHARGLEKENKTEERGVILSLSKPIHIPKSVDIIKVRIQTADGEKTLNLIENRKDILPDAGTECLFKLRRSYITEVTVCES